MFRSLRSRLLLSYIAVIIAVLFVVAAALFLIATTPGVRYFPTLQRLSIISRSNRNELIRLREAGADPKALEMALDRTAAENKVRIVITDSNTSRVVYDSDVSDNWVGVTIDEVDRPQRLMPGVDNNTVFGRFRHPNGSSWLVYSQPFVNPAYGRIQIFYAQREPTAFSFFRELFLRPIVGAGVLAFLLAILLALWIARSVARPLQKLANAAEAVAEGDYDQQLPLHGPEEVQRVAHSFNSMAVRVKTTQQAQRDFVGNVSHDLKTPLTAITGWSQALLDGTAVTPAEQQRAAAIIHNEAERMARMVAQLLDLARIESGQLELARAPVDLGQLLTDLRQSLSLRAQEQEVHLTLDARPVAPVMGDADRLMQVFTNLVDNALTHTPAGGRVHLAVRPHGDKAVEAIVQDTGRGIAPEELPRIFERFYQVDKSRARANGRRGSGLGLAIVRELVEAHCGRIQARSQVGKGSAFIIRLPTSDVPEVSTVLSNR